MKIGILGTRGIPNAYGGFEQFAEYLALGLIKKGCDVWVYNAHNHPCKSSEWKGIHLIHCFDPEHKIGASGQFIYDLNCIIDSRKRNFDILLQLGYTSSSVWHKLLPQKSYIVTNMDGLEWKRSKYSPTIRKFLKYAEKLAVKSSDLLIADSEVIQDYLDKTYKVHSEFIPYGAEIFNHPDPEILKNYTVSPHAFYLVIARMQPDNHIEEIINGVFQSNQELPLLVIGNIKNSFGKYLVKNYTSHRIHFLGSIFDQDLLNQLRFFSKIYFHGHSAGGTNPSLLEAMAASSFICAHDNPFNKSVLEDNACFFKTENDIKQFIDNELTDIQKEVYVKNNLEKLRIKYNWDKIIDAYYQSFVNLVKN